MHRNGHGVCARSVEDSATSIAHTPLKQLKGDKLQFIKLIGVYERDNRRRREFRLPDAVI
jgi:hypothetical protein